MSENNCCACFVCCLISGLSMTLLICLYSESDWLAIGMFFIGVLLSICFLDGCNIKKKSDCLDLVLVCGGLVISGGLLYLCFKKPGLDLTSKLDLGDVAGVIAAVGALITARFIYRQFQDSKRQFSLSSFQSAFFDLYDLKNIQLVNDGDTNNKLIIRRGVALLELITRNSQDYSLSFENAEYYVKLVVHLVGGKEELFKRFDGKCSERYKSTWKDIKKYYDYKNKKNST